MAAKPTMLTAEGLKNLEEELEFLHNVKRKEIAEKIKVARSYGDLSTGKQMKYKIVGSGSNEANPKEGKISDESPIGRALMEKSVGDVVEVETPSGVIGIKIIEISK